MKTPLYVLRGVIHHSLGDWSARERREGFSWGVTREAFWGDLALVTLLHVRQKGTLVYVLTDFVCFLSLSLGATRGK